VTIRTQETRGVEDRVTAHRDVLADLGDERAPTLIDRLARAELERIERLEVGGVGAERRLDDIARETLEVRFAGDKVRLAIDLDHCRGLAIGRLLERDHALRRDAGGFLVGLGEPLLAHEFGGGVEITVGFDECFLALHHAGAGALAQLFDRFCCDAHE
jgi:hypothetical protein